jgi:hypothetical protein
VSSPICSCTCTCPFIYPVTIFKFVVSTRWNCSGFTCFADMRMNFLLLSWYQQW